MPEKVRDCKNVKFATGTVKWGQWALCQCKLLIVGHSHFVPSTPSLPNSLSKDLVSSLCQGIAVPMNLSFVPSWERFSLVPKLNLTVSFI